MTRVPVSYDVFGNPIYQSGKDPFLAIADQHSNPQMSPYPVYNSAEMNARGADYQQQAPSISFKPSIAPANDFGQAAATNDAKSLFAKSAPSGTGGSAMPTGPTQPTPQQDTPASTETAQQAPAGGGLLQGAAALWGLTKIPDALDSLSGLFSSGGGAPSIFTNAGIEGSLATPELFSGVGELSLPTLEGFDLAGSLGTDLFTPEAVNSALEGGTEATAEGGLSEILGPAAAIYGGYHVGSNLLNNKKDPIGGAISGATIGYQFGGPIGAGIGAVVGLGMGFLGSGGPNPRERQRSSVLESMQGMKGAEGDIPGVRGTTMRLTDDIGRVQDSNDPLAGFAIAMADPIAEALSGTGQSVSGGASALREDSSAILASTILQGATSENDVVNNLLSYLKQTGATRDGILRAIGQVYAAGRIDGNRLQVYAQNISRLTGWTPEKIKQTIISYSKAKK